MAVKLVGRRLPKTILTGGGLPIRAIFAGSSRKDRTFHINPACTAKPASPRGCPTSASGNRSDLWDELPHQLHAGRGGRLYRDRCPVSRDRASGGFRGSVATVGKRRFAGRARPKQAALNPATVHLDPTKHYYISVLPGDAGQFV